MVLVLRPGSHPEAWSQGVLVLVPVPSPGSGSGSLTSAALPQTRGPRSKALSERAVLNCQYSMATFSTAERKRRPHGDRKSAEMALHLKQTFEAAVLTELYPRSQIDLYVQVGGGGGDEVGERG